MIGQKFSRILPSRVREPPFREEKERMSDPFQGES